MEKEKALQNQEKYKPLIDSELWPLIKSYTDVVCTKSNLTHDSRRSLSDPVYKKTLDLYKKAVSKAIDMKINPQLLDLLWLKFVSDEDIDIKLSALKNIKKYYL
jgi:hypothetical protein